MSDEQFKTIRIYLQIIFIMIVATYVLVVMQFFDIFRPAIGQR